MENSYRGDRMKFDTAAELVNHEKRFGKDSQYSTLEKLNKRQNELIREKSNEPENYKVDDIFKFAKTSSNRSSVKLDFLRDSIRGNEEEFAKARNIALQNRENEMLDELKRYKRERSTFRENRAKQQEEFEKLVRELGARKDREFRAAIEQDQIRNKLNEMKNGKYDQEKAYELERLLGDRENLRRKEEDFIRELADLEQNMRTLDRFQMKGGATSRYDEKGFELKRATDMLMEDNAEKIERLSDRLRNLETERMKIMQGVERIRVTEIGENKPQESRMVRNSSGLLAASNVLDSGLKGRRGVGITPIQFTESTPRIFSKITQSPMLPSNDAKQQFGMVFQNNQRPHHRASNSMSMMSNQMENTQATFPQRTRLNTQVRNSLNLEPSKRESTSLEPLKRGYSPLSSAQRRDPQSQFRDSQVLTGGDLLNRNSIIPNHLADNPSALRDEYLSHGGHNPTVLKVLDNMHQNVRTDHSTQTQPQAIPEEHQLNLLQKEQENQRLREELAKLKVSKELMSTNANPMTIPGNFTLGEMALRVGGLQKSASSSMLNYGGSREFFVQNEVRNVDLTEEERMLVNLQAQDVDSLRVLAQMPIGTELYQFKMNQYKELSMGRAEMEKMLQEQRVGTLRRQFEKKRREEDKQFDNQKFVDDWRKQIIGARLRRDLNFGKGERQYDPREGFIVHWDYCLGIPKRMDYIQLVYAIYVNGEEVYAPRMVEPHDCEIDTSATNRCIIGENHHLQDIPANSNCLLIFEIQAVYSKSSDGKVVSYGWSQLDLFDAKRQLRRGKFKVPLYVVPTITSIDIDGIKYLEPVDSGILWFYLRISWPNNDEFASVQSLYPENTHFEYNIPQIHLRAFRPPVERIIERVVEREKTPEPIDDGDKNQQPEEPPKQDDTNNGDGDSEGNDTIMELPHEEEKKPKKRLVKKPKADDSMTKSTTVMPPPGQGKRKGIHLIIHQVKNHVARSHLKVAAAIFEESQLVLDERGRQCAFNTSVHNPLDLNTKSNRNLSNISMDKSMSNKAQGQDIIFNEDKVFLRDIPLMLKTQKIKRDVYLNIQVLEKPEPVNVQTTNASISYRKQNETANYGNMEFELLGWYLIKINTGDGDVLSGKFCRQLFAPPLRKPPLDTQKVQNMDVEIEFTLQGYIFQDADLVKAQKGPKKKTKAELKAEEEERKKREAEEAKLREVAIDNAPYISNTKPQFTDKTFEKGHGVDFYIDGCRFLPDNVTVCRVTFTLVNREYEILRPLEAAVPELDSPSYSPLFAFRTELRMDRFDPTALALISIETIDKSTNETRIVGYSALNLFINRFTKQQPESNTESDIVLLDGRYQLPIFCQEPFRTSPFNMEKMNSLERLPTASVLIRIHHAPLSNDGLRVLSITDVPKKEWAKKDVWRPRPMYGQGAYNTSFCPTRDSEKELFVLRQERPDMTVRETTQILLGADGINKELNDKEMIQYLSKKIQRNSSTIMIDLMYFAHYRAQAGFKFALDGIHMAPNDSIPYIGLYCLNPPGALYEEEGDRAKIQITTLLNWEGPAKSPQFLDGYITFKDMNFEKNLCMIIDIRSVNFAKIPPLFSKIGWTICPIFSPDGYVLSGLYQIPLFKGEFPNALRTELQENDPWPYLMDLVKNKRNPHKVAYLENASVMCRLVDSQREGHFNVPWDVNRIDYRYLPQNKLRECGYNITWEAKLAGMTKLQSIVPNKGNPFDYNHKITDAFIEELGLTQFAHD